MKTLLLTGFEPFLNHPFNPTEYIAHQLNGNVVGSYQVRGKVLPVEYGSSAHELITYYEELRPDAVIMLGLAAGRNRLTPERVAINVNDGPSDNSGEERADKPIIDGGPAAFFSTLPVRKFVNILNKRGIPAELSNTAGAYLCNHVMYSMLHHLEKSKHEIPAGFIHVPPSYELAVNDRSISGWPKETLLYAIEIVIDSLDKTLTGDEQKWKNYMTD
ncbi:pyroglutamyl-peptidase I [Fictibacillus terranigra]|uniref:Pyroglutamyl-peptidase I n=1 Tax=Fictibacillus terranigra TaxID=3058424 RepID=A0ABT8EC61_9BACL|nr:pyroglutamyl-peptidase I [Fictibacillus sp. CENA-BCM004]MDN4075523.1 pyroglutamyl-peptidase I [Fictibacillus sp. CENA-BCM004]